MMAHESHEPKNGGGGAVSSQAAAWLTPAEYLEFERRAETKHEYYDGQVFAMTGASRPHNLIVGNLVAALHRQLQGRACEVYPSDMRLRAAVTGAYMYPDVTVTCGAAQLEDEHLDTLLNPTVLIEVLSASTERHDRGRKSAQYRMIASLQEYLLVSQAEPRIERYSRGDAHDWPNTEVTGLGRSVELTSIACVLALGDVYDKVF